MNLQVPNFYIQSVNQFLFLVSEAFRGLKSHRSVVLPTIVTIFLCSVLLSASLFALRGGARLVEMQGAFYTVEAFINDRVPSVERERLLQELRAEKWLDSVEYVSEEMAFAVFAEHFSHDMLKMVDANPLPASFKMHIAERYRSPDVLEEWIGILERSGYYDAVQAPLSFAKKFSEWKLRIFFWPAVCVVFLLFTLGLIIGNAVRLSLFSRKILVENMKYTGASRIFIEFPFVLEGVLQGAVASLCGSLLVAFFADSFGAKFPIAGEALAGNFMPVALTSLVVTLLAGFVSLRAVRTFLAGDRGADS